MRRVAVLAAGLLMLAVSPAHAQQKKQGAEPGAPTTRYFQLFGDPNESGVVDAILKENRRGRTIISAELDLCYTVDKTSSRKDRVIIALSPEGERFAGTAPSQEDKTPVKVQLTRTTAEQGVAFELDISRGGATSTFVSEDNSDMSESELAQNLASEDSFTPEPENFSELSPRDIGMRVERARFLDIVKGLREQNVQMLMHQLVTGCPALRTGQQDVKFSVDPVRAVALVAKLRSTPGVLAIGWEAGSVPITSAIRLPLSAWRGADGAPDREKLTAAIAAAAAKIVSAKFDSAAWNKAGGEILLNFKRPNQSVPGLGLTDHVKVDVLIGPESPRAKENFIVWIGRTTVAAIDEGPGARFAAIAADREGEAGEEAIPDEDLVQAIARDLKGQTWDSDKLAWR